MNWYASVVVSYRFTAVQECACMQKSELLSEMMWVPGAVAHICNPVGVIRPNTRS